MGRLPLHTLWRVSGALLLVAVTVAAIVPMPGPDTPGHGDKLLHALTFIVLTLWFAGFAPGRTGWVRTVVGLLVFGAAIEGAQALTGYRQADPWDFAADAAGVLGGLLLALAGLAGWCERLQLRLAASGGD